MAYGRREPRGGDAPVTEDDLRAAAAAIERALSAPGDAARVGGRAARPPATRRPPCARRSARASRSPPSRPPTEVAAAELAGLAAFSDTPSHWWRAATRGSRSGSPRRCRPRAPVDAGARGGWDADGVVACARTTARSSADAAVVAVPASVIGAIAFEPALPAHVTAALARVRYGHAAKLFVPLRGGPRPPTSAVLSVPEPLLDVDGARGRRGPARRPRLRRLAPARSTASRSPTGPSAGWTSLARLRPDLALDPGARAALDVVGRPVGARRLLRPRRRAGRPGADRAVRAARLRGRAHRRAPRGAHGGRAAQRRARRRAGPVRALSEAA